MAAWDDLGFIGAIGQRHGGLFDPRQRHQNQPDQRIPDAQADRHDDAQPQPGQGDRRGACFAPDAGGLVIDHQEAVDRMPGNLAMAGLTGGLVVDRVDAAQHLAGLRVLQQRGLDGAAGQGGACQRRVGQGARGRGIRGKPHLEIRVQDHHPGNVVLPAKIGQDRPEPWNVAFEHGVFQRRLQKPVDLQRGAAVLGHQAVLIGAAQHHQKQGRHGDQQPGDCQHQLALQAGADPAVGVQYRRGQVQSSTTNSFL